MVNCNTLNALISMNGFCENVFILKGIFKRVLNGVLILSSSLTIIISANTTAATCKGGVVKLSDMRPDGVYLTVADSGNMLMCSPYSSSGEIISKNCIHMSSIAALAYATGQPLTIDIDNSLTDSCDSVSIPDNFPADVSYIAIETSTITNTFDFAFESGVRWESFHAPQTALRVGETGFRWTAYRGVGRFFAFNASPTYDKLRAESRAFEGLNGGYVYTIFDTRGGNEPNTSVNQLESISLDWFWGDPNIVGGSARFIIKDRNGGWFITNENISYQQNTTGELFVENTSWSQISSADDLDNITDNQAGSISIQPSPSTPDLSKILGGGIYFDSFEGNDDSLTFFFDNLTFVGR